MSRLDENYFFSVIMSYIYSLIQEACEVEMLRGECASMMEGMAEEV